MTNHGEASPTAAEADPYRTLKARQRAVWALGDYPKTAREVLSELGRGLVAACGIARGQRVLDVAAGAGNVAIPAAETGAEVVASDFTVELFTAGRREAATRGVRLDWVQADAEALPFGDGEFDVVTSCIGAMFAPNQQKAAGELVRVCRAGGTIGMINWTPQGWVGGSFGIFARYDPPPPPGVFSPFLWGTEEHVRALFGDRVEALETKKKKLLVDQFREPVEACDYYKTHFGPAIATYANVADDPERTAMLDRELLEHGQRTNLARPGDPARYEFEYLLVVARKASGGKARASHG